MKYGIVIERRAQAQLAALPKAVRRRLERRIDSLADDPRHAGTKPLQGTLKPLRCIRQGDYRAIYSVDDNVRLVRVTHVGHRRDVYSHAERGA